MNNSIDLEYGRKELAVAQPMTLAPSAPSAVTPASLLQMAASTGNLELVREFMQLRREWEADEARKAYVQAMADFKAEHIRVSKDKENKQYNSRYSSLENYIETVTPFLSKHGLSANWDLDQTKGITVTCILTHKLGHSTRASLNVPPDASGAKNAIQQIKSSITYAKICTFESVCGLAPSGSPANMSDDGNGAGNSQQMGDEQFANLQDTLDAARTLDELKAAFKKAYTVAESMNDKQAMQDLIRLKDRRKDLLK